MQNLTRILLVLLALSVVVRFSGGVPARQDGTGKPERAGQGQNPAAGAKKPVYQRNRGEKQAAIKKALPTLKTSICEAITICEKESGGRAFAAGVEIKDGKPFLIVNLYTEKNDRPVSYQVDPDTKKTKLLELKKGKEEGGEGDEPAGGDEEGG